MLGLVMLVAAGCSRDRQSAERALAEIDTVVAQASLHKYVPEQAAVVQSEIAALKSSFDRRDYSAVLAASPAVLAEATRLAAAAVARKQQADANLIKEWTALDASMPPLVSTVRVRIDALSKSKHQRKGVDLPTAKQRIAAGIELWDMAEAEFESGQFEQAVALLKDAKPKAESAAAALGIALPAED